MWTDKAPPADAAVDIFASPTIWGVYGSLYKEGQAASKIAFDLSHAQSNAEFRTKARELLLACDTCYRIIKKQLTVAGRALLTERGRSASSS